MNLQAIHSSGEVVKGQQVWVQASEATCKVEMSEGTPTSSNLAARERQEMAASGITPLSTFCTHHHELKCWHAVCTTVT